MLKLEVLNTGLGTFRSYTEGSLVRSEWGSVVLITLDGAIVLVPGDQSDHAPYEHVEEIDMDTNVIEVLGDLAVRQ